MNSSQQLLESIICYAQKEESIRGLILIGSQARKENHADEFSDIDLILITNNPDHFILTDEWLHDIDTSYISFVETTIGGHKEKRVMFHNALDVDFIVISQEDSSVVFNSLECAEVLNSGYKILINKDNLVIPDPLKVQADLILHEETFKNTVNDFWYHAIWSAKKLLRGELWAAKFCVDSYMKQKLLWMMEQYEHAKHGDDYHTWYGGRFIDTWLDQDVKAHLSQTFAHYNVDDINRALIETMTLFRTLAVEVAAAYTFKYPLDADKYATDWVCGILSHK